MAQFFFVDCEGGKPKLLPSEDVFRLIAEICNFKDLAVLSRLCKPAARAVYHDRRRRVNDQVSPFVGDRLEDLRNVLQVNRALLTGSAVLRMLVDHVVFSPSGLAIVVPSGTSAVAVVTFVKSLGYESLPLAASTERARIHAGMYPRADWRVGIITTYLRPGDMRRIEIIRSTTPYAMDVVLAHPNTLLQNFATGTLLGCLFPSTTLDGHAMATVSDVPNRVVAKQLVKYKRRGFHIHADNSYFAQPCGANCPTIRHLAGDPAVCILRYSKLYGEDDENDRHDLPPIMRPEHLTQMQPNQEYRARSHCANILCDNYNM